MASLTPVVLWYTADAEAGKTSIRVRFYDGETAVLEQSILVLGLIDTDDAAVAAVKDHVAETGAQSPVWRDHPEGARLTADIAETIEQYPAKDETPEVAP